MFRYLRVSVLAPRRAQTVKLKGIFGALRDASPDAWGRRIIEKHTGRADLTEVDYLLHSPDDRAGALSFGRDKAPPAPLRKFNQVIRMTVDLPMTVESSLEVKPIDESTIEIKAKMKRKMSFKELGITHYKGEFQQFHSHSRVSVPVQMNKMHISFKKGMLEIHIPRKRTK